MKVKNLALGMFAISLMASCSNNDLVDENLSTGNLSGNSYVAVKVVTPSMSNESRALGGFSDGTVDENSVTSVQFLFFDKDGNSCGIAPQTINSFSWTKQTAGSSQNIEAYSDAVILFSNPTSVPAKILAILNPTGNEGFSASTTLADVQAKSADYRSYQTNGNFVMSNSVYKNANGDIMYTTPLELKNIAKTQDDAKNNPVTIPVERVLAKVGVTDGSLNVTSAAQVLKVDGVDLSITASLVGFKVTYDNNVSYLLKNMTGYENYGGWNWNDVNNMRSYWATSAVGTYENYNYNEVSANKNPVYCNENTSSTTPKLIVAAQLKATSGGAAVTLMKWRGVMYSEQGLRNHFANILGKYYKKTSAAGVTPATYASIAPTDFAFTTQGSRPYNVTVSLVSGAPTFYTLSTDGSGTKIATDATTALNADINSLGDILYWKDGMTYYYVDIEHNGGEGLGAKGLVRNHVYQISIASVTGLGTPIWQPSNDIIPETPTNESSYIAAKINVLGWKIVSQSVDLK